jgi:quercetin dioxygenase-like cupin family protein
MYDIQYGLFTMPHTPAEPAKDQPPTSSSAGPRDPFADRLKSLRELRGLSLRELARRTSLSASFLSQLERGTASPTLETMRRLADGLGVELPSLFSEDEHKSPRVVSIDERPTIHLGGASRTTLISHGLSRNFEVYETELAPNETTGSHPYAHGDSEEIVLVLAGMIEVQVAEQVYKLTVNDSLSFQSDLAHIARNRSDRPARFIWIISPPSTAIARQFPGDPSTPAP